MRHTLLLGCLLAAGVCVLLPGCQKEKEVVYYDNEPEYAVVSQPPPALIVEKQSRCPGEGYVWVDGYWNWEKHRYVWKHGHWGKPPHGEVHWVAPRYEKHEQEHRYMPAHWRGHRAPEGEHHERH